MANEWQKEVAAALATKLASVDGIKVAVPLGDDNLSELPGAMVLVPELELTGRTGNYTTWKVTFPIVIVHDILPTVEETLASMVDIIDRVIDAWWTGTMLGLSYVLDSYPKSFNPELFELAGDELPSHKGSVVVEVKRIGQRTA